MGAKEYIRQKKEAIQKYIEKREMAKLKAQERKAEILEQKASKAAARQKIYLRQEKAQKTIAKAKATQQRISPGFFTHVASAAKSMPQSKSSGSIFDIGFGSSKSSSSNPFDFKSSGMGMGMGNLFGNPAPVRRKRAKRKKGRKKR